MHHIVPIENRQAVEGYIDHYSRFYVVPASTHYHHVFNGGLAQHVAEVLELCHHIANSRTLPSVSRSHLTMAAILHDFGKIYAYRYDMEKQEWVGSISDTRVTHELYPILDFYEVTGVDLPLEVKSAILGHMGGWSKTGVYPDTVLGAILASADLISAKLERKIK